MKKFSEYKEWKSEHIREMSDLTFASPKSIFIYKRFTIKDSCLDNREILFADDEIEAIGYIRHIFLYDILNDTVDDLNYEQSTSFECQEDAISLMNYWYKIGKIMKTDNIKKESLKLCEEFNKEFSNRENKEYEITIINGANKLKNFLVSKYKDNINFDKYKLETICSNDLFAGKLLNEFLNNLFG